MTNMSIKKKLAAVLGAALLMTAAAHVSLAQDIATPGEAQESPPPLVEQITPPKNEETPQEQKKVAAPGAAWTVTGDSVSVTVTGEAGLRMYVDATVGWDDEVYAGETVTFSGLEAGKSYGLEVDYYDVQQGVSAYRTSIEVPAASVDTPTDPPASTETPPPASAETTPPASSGVEMLTPPPSAGNAPEAVKQFALAVSADDGVITAGITGASEREVDIELLLGGQRVEMKALIGNGSVTFGKQGDGTYTVRAAYVTPADGITAVEASVEIKNTGSAGSVPAQKVPTVMLLGASVVHGDSWIEVRVTDADPWPLVVFVGSDYKTVSKGETVRFENLSAGVYDIEVDYDDLVPSVSPFRTSVVLAAPAPVPVIKEIAFSATGGTEKISVTITDASSLPVTVKILKDGWEIARKTIAAGVGSESFSGLAAGTYAVAVDYDPAQSGVPAREQTGIIVTAKKKYTTLKYGDTGDAVEEMTERLRDLGYMDDDVRRYSSAVREAVKAFQKLNGLEPDGVAGQETLEALFSNDAVPYGASGMYTTLKRGDKGLASIYRLQQRLKDLGYYTIAVDGVYGSGTERAVRHFQRINGLSKTGVADDATQKLLYSSSAKPADSASADNYKTLSRSSSYHPAVVPLQRRLKELGYAVGSADGYFGSRTYRAVREFQKRNGLKVTGVADEAMQRVLFSSSAIAASGSSSSSSGSVSYRLLTWGSQGEDVRTLQKALLAKGYTQVRVADGIYGQWTYDAVRAFQKDHRLAVDGIAGRNTQNALYGTNY